MPTSDRSVFYDNKTYTDKVYNKAIDDMIKDKDRQLCQAKKGTETLEKRNVENVVRCTQVLNALARSSYVESI